MFRITALRDQLALDGMDRVQIGNLMTLMVQNAPNRSFHTRHGALEAAKSLKFSDEDQARVAKAVTEIEL